MNRINVPDGCDEVHILLDYVSAPMAVFIMDGSQRTIYEDLRLPAEGADSLMLSLYLAERGIRSQILPPHYREKLLAYFREKGHS